MISIDVEAAHAHLQLLGGADAPRPWLATDDSSASRSVRLLFGTLDELSSDMTLLQNQRFAIHVTVNAMHGRRRAISEVARIRAVFAEMDRRPTHPFQLPPSLRVQTSPGKGHIYWLADPDDPPTVTEASAMLRAIVARYGADPHAADVARVLRLAGTMHQKTAKPHRVKIVGGTGRYYRRSELLEAFPPPLTHPIQATKPASFDAPDRYIAATVRGVVVDLSSARQGERNSMLNRAAFRLGQVGLELEAATAALTPTANEIGLGAREIMATIRSGHRAGIQNPRGGVAI